MHKKFPGVESSRLLKPKRIFICIFRAFYLVPGLVFLLLNLSAHSQSANVWETSISIKKQDTKTTKLNQVKLTVISAETKKRIADAEIYFQGNLIGKTDAKGKFTYPIPESQIEDTMYMVIQCQSGEYEQYLLTLFFCELPYTYKIQLEGWQDDKGYQISADNPNPRRRKRCK